MFCRKNLGIFLILTLGNIAAAQFDMAYFADKHCRGPRIRCPDYAPYRCCGLPPHPPSLPYAAAISGGQVGVLTWHDVSVTGECAGATRTTSLGACYLNTPFEVLSVTPIPPHRPRRSFGDNPSNIAMENNTIESRSTTTMQEGVFQKSRVPPLKGSKSDYATTSCGRPNAVGFAGDDKDYYLKPGVLNEAFVEDLLKLSGDEMIKKYKLKTWDESKQEREASVGATPPGSGP